MSKKDTLFPSKWLKHSDIPEDGWVVTITGVDLEMVGDEEESKPVISFKETGKGLVLNKTNYDLIAPWHGEDTDDWRGKKITLYKTLVDFKGKPVNAIRVVPKQAKMPAPPAEAVAAAEAAVFPEA